MSLMCEEERAAFGGADSLMGELAADGRLTDAVRALLGWPFNDEGITVAEATGYFESAGRYVPNLLNLLQQWGNHPGPTPEDPVVLGAISTPVLVLHGSDTSRPGFAH